MSSLLEKLQSTQQGLSKVQFRAKNTQLLIMKMEKITKQSLNKVCISCQWTAQTFTMITTSITWKASRSPAAPSTPMTKHPFKRIKKMMKQRLSRPQGSSRPPAAANPLEAIILRWQMPSSLKNMPSSRASAQRKCYLAQTKKLLLSSKKKS